MFHFKSVRGLLMGFCALSLVTAAPAFAQNTAPGGAPNALPARVARLTAVDGYVHVDSKDHTPGDPAQLNMPLIEGQTIVTGGDGDAEVEFEDGSVARVTPNSSVSLAHLSASADGLFATHLTLVSGLAYFELRSAAKFTYAVEAAGDVVTPVENSTVRVNLDEAPAAIAVLDGMVHVERQDSYNVVLRASETLRSDVSNQGRYFLTPEIAADTWDQWNESRDQAAADAASTQTAARDGYAGNAGYGWSDLDNNGTWYNAPGQGQVWQPVGGDSASFDPYANGSWIWYPNGGYQWASAYSWGWTPFRCGSWSYWNTFGWGWSANAACGGFGFAGLGGGYGNGYGFGGGAGYGYGGGLNVVRVPRGYPLHRLPPGQIGVHPIVRVGTTQMNIVSATRSSPTELQTGLRRIGGTVATPLPSTVHGYTMRGGSAVGASLNRDFPVDRATHQAVLGVVPTGAPVPSALRSGNYATYGTVRGGPQPVARPYGQPVQAYGARQTTAGQPASRMSQPAPQQRMSQPAPQQRMSQPAPASHPSYSAPAPAARSAPAPASSGGGSKK